MGASQSQKWANSAPEMASPTKLQTGFQFLTKDFLRFWMVDIRREGRSKKSAPQKRQKAHHSGAREETEAGMGREKARCTWGECAPQAPGCLSCSGREGTKRRPNRVCVFVEYLRART